MAGPEAVGLRAPLRAGCFCALMLGWGALVESTAGASSSTLGVGVDFMVDPTDQVDTLSKSSAGLGGQLRVPLNVGLGHGASLRVSLQTSLSSGQDRVEWSQYDGAAHYYSDDHWTLVNNSSLMLGPQVDLSQGSGLRPYLGAQAGAALVTNWHSFHGDAAILLDPDQGDVTSSSYVDPYTRQLAPMVDIFGGAHLLAGSPVAIDLEAGYTVSFLDQAALQKSRPELGAVRMAYGLNAIRVGVTAAFAL